MVGTGTLTRVGGAVRTTTCSAESRGQVTFGARPGSPRRAGEPAAHARRSLRSSSAPACTAAPCVWSGAEQRARQRRGGCARDAGALEREAIRRRVVPGRRGSGRAGRTGRNGSGGKVDRPVAVGARRAGGPRVEPPRAVSCQIVEPSGGCGWPEGAPWRLAVPPPDGEQVVALLPEQAHGLVTKLGVGDDGHALQHTESQSCQLGRHLVSSARRRPAPSTLHTVSEPSP